MSTKRSRGAVVALGCGLAILWAFGRSPSSWPVKNAAPITRRVLFFGDSLVTGHGLDDPEASSIPAQVAAELGVDHEAYGVNGLTSVAALGELESLSLETELVVVSLGGNDLLTIANPAVDDVHSLVNAGTLQGDQDAGALVLFRTSFGAFENRDWFAMDIRDKEMWLTEVREGEERRGEEGSKE